MTTSYTSTAKSLHWLMAILIFGLLALGFYMHDLPLSPQKLQLYSWHKWAGVTAFLLVAWLHRRSGRPLSPALGNLGNRENSGASRWVRDMPARRCSTAASRPA